MSLIVENGTGLSNAESYISVANADTRMTNLGNSNWLTMSTLEKEQALRRATVYMEQAYRSKWQGTRTTITQALSWPRYDVLIDRYNYIASTVVPADVANACADLAFKAAGGDLAADLSRAVKREKVGPIETEYADFTPQQVRYVSIDRTLAPYMVGGGAFSRLIRA